MTSGDRWIALDGAVNARDVGGLPLADGTGIVRPGVLIRADNLQDLSAADIALLVDKLGVKTVVDLRSRAELAAEGPGPLAATDVVHHHLSLVPEVGEKTDLVSDVLRRHQGAGPLTPYLGYLRDAPDAIVAAARVVADPASGAVIAHCAAGKDRTGVTVAMLLDAAGVARPDIAADYALSASVIGQIIARLMATETYRPDLEGRDPQEQAPRAETMTAFLAEVDAQYGGPTAWLLANGLTEDELAALRRRLRSDVS